LMAPRGGNQSVSTGAIKPDGREIFPIV
jgi:hypothetical protein